MEHWFGVTTSYMSLRIKMRLLGYSVASSNGFSRREIAVSLLISFFNCINAKINDEEGSKQTRFELGVHGLVVIFDGEDVSVRDAASQRELASQLCDLLSAG